MTPDQTARNVSCKGFTLIEVMVVLVLLSLMALMGWRSLDGMLRQQQALSERAESLQTLHTALAQWQTDLSIDRKSVV